jgi:NHLM bacteriocin system ABC transporter peptidase/ATP-binding protein
MEKNRKKVKTPTVLQMEAVECGAASLAIVLGYYGKYVPLEVLRRECGVSRDGSKASNILKVARNYGLTAKGYRYEADDLPGLKLPFVVFWNFNHFLVVEGFGHKRVFLNDPCCGPRTVSIDEFNDSFTGVVLILEPGPDFEKGGERSNLIDGLKARLADSHSAIAYAILAGLALVLPALVIPVFTKVFVDDILVNRLKEWILPLAIGMLVTAVIRAGLTWLQRHSLLCLEMKLALSTSGRFFWHILRLPIDFFQQRSGGDISSRVEINDTVANLLSARFAGAVLNVIMIIFYCAVLFRYNVMLTIIGIFIALLNVLALYLVSRKRIDVNRSLLQENGKLWGTSFAGLRMIETLKASGTESDFYTRWSGYLAKVVNGEQELNVYTQFLSVIPPFLSSLNTIAILAIGGSEVMSGRMTAGTLVAYQSLMSFFITPVNDLVNMGSSLQEMEGNMNRLDDVLHCAPDEAVRTLYDERQEQAEKLIGEVEIKNLCFGYNVLEPPFIDNFSLKLRPGSRAAIVGASGSGKSTIGKLISGLYTQWDGEVLFDGRPLRSIPGRTLHNSFSAVDQSIMLFEGTVRENISLWDPTLPDSHIIKACKDACVHEIITSRDSEYNTLVEEEGRNFSGGERQRLEIARSLAINPTILLLDEATSALDPLTEKIIDTNIRQRGCTAIIIAHRLSTIRDCDDIIVLEKGKIVQRGTHDEMKDLEGPYKTLINMY